MTGPQVSGNPTVGVSPTTYRDTGTTWREHKHALRRFAPAIPMMKATEPGTGTHACRRRGPAFHLPWCRCVLAKEIVNPVVVVVVDIVAQQPPQMSFVQRDDVVQDLPPTASDTALRN